jgi:hypothetical protein
MGVELRRGVPVHRASGVMLEFRGYEFARLLGGVVAAEPRMCVSLQLVQCGSDGGTMRISHPLIAAHEGRQRNRFGCGKSSIPTGPMFNRLGSGPIRVRVLLREAMFDHLFLSLRMHSFGETVELQRRYVAAESKGGGQLALPLPFYRVALLVVGLRVGCELKLVITLCLACRKGFRNGEHDVMASTRRRGRPAQGCHWQS